MDLLIFVWLFLSIKSIVFHANSSLNSGICSAAVIENCPLDSVKAIIERAAIISHSDAVTQMQMVRRVMEDIFGGNWGVLIIKDFELIASSVHWTIPDQKHMNGSAAFCLHAEGNWQYNVFKTGDADTPGRMTVEEAIKKMNEKRLIPKRLVEPELSLRTRKRGQDARDSKEKT